MKASPVRPTRAEQLAAENTTIPDLIAPGLRVLFCGINPGLYSGATGHHFAKPGNRFWPALHASGFTPHLVSPANERELLDHGVGITNFIARTTATAAELGREEYPAGRKTLERKIRKYHPRWLAIVGLGAYRIGFADPFAVVGRQERMIGSTGVWVLPNPSGLNAHYQPKELARLFGELATASLFPRSSP
ncbi:MAG TPA: G/U mismatch-specific DNA glycosylase [Gemmatimonadales bacterium]